jgi:hypothetical protein
VTSPVPPPQKYLHIIKQKTPSICRQHHHCHNVLRWEPPPFLPPLPDGVPAVRGGGGGGKIGGKVGGEIGGMVGGKVGGKIGGGIGGKVGGEGGGKGGGEDSGKGSGGCGEGRGRCQLL